jgi:outer membrane immunogenic protein
MSGSFRFVALLGLAVGGVSAASALPLPSDPPAGWSPLEGALRSTIAPPLNAQPSWSGFYVGVNGGGAWDWTPTASMFGLPVSLSLDPTASQMLTGDLTGSTGGFVGGAQLGYNYLWPFGLMTGIEADFDGITSASSASQGSTALLDVVNAGFTDFGSLSVSRRVDYLGTVRGRLGYQALPGLLFYATAGLAYGHAAFTAGSSIAIFDATGTPALLQSSLANYSSTRTGWTVGGGVEFPLWSNLTAKAEYLYYDLGTAYVQAPFVVALGGLAPGVAQQTGVRFTGNIARFGVNYRFDAITSMPPVAPLIAKY